MEQVFLKVVDPEVAKELAALGFQYIKEQNSFAFLCNNELMEVFLNRFSDAQFTMNNKLTF